MILAPDVFAIEQGRYTPTVAIDWFADKTNGTPSPLWTGRTLRRTPDHGWEIAGTKPGTPWKPTSKAAPTIKKALASLTADDPEPGYYELVGPKLAGNPHGLDDVELRAHGSGLIDQDDLQSMPRTSLFAWPAWLERTGLHGILFTHTDTDGTVHYAAVRSAYL
jgi:hypothetical protein